MEAQIKFSPAKYGGGSRINSNYGGGGGERSELVEEEEFQISLGTKEKNDIFKNNLYKTGKSNRYRGFGEVSESGISEEMVQHQSSSSQGGKANSLIKSKESEASRYSKYNEAKDSQGYYGYDDSDEF